MARHQRRGWHVPARPVLAPPSISPEHRFARAARFGAGAAPALLRRVGGFSRVETKMHIRSGEERLRAEPQQVLSTTSLGNRSPYCHRPFLSPAKL